MRTFPLDPEFITDGSEPVAGLLRELQVLSPTNLPLLVLGPTGCGKELLVRQIHHWSGRRGPLVPVNCCALSEGILESELFGHVKGAFTGADRDRPGAVESAEGGTLFLDEVAELSPRVQALFLRVLQEREIRRVGSDRPKRVDVRFVAATNRPLDDLVRQRLYREDLLFRLQGAVVRAPTLAERRHEFSHLVPRLAERAAKGLGRATPDVERGLAEALGNLPWPGNVRQLLHHLERAVLRAGDGPLCRSHFLELAGAPVEEGSWTQATRAFQRRHLQETLERHGFRVAETARVLGLSRPALYAAARRLNVEVTRESRLRGSQGAGIPCTR